MDFRLHFAVLCIALLLLVGCAKKESASSVVHKDGVTFVLGSWRSKLESAKDVRYLTGEEKTALRHFIKVAEYKPQISYADFKNIPLVRIDGVLWWVYRSSLYRFGESKKERKIIDGLAFSKRHHHDIEFDTLVAWYRAEKD